ncbi:LOW QUALITY PROTEIN: G-protein coupled receptor moody-like [Haliotis rubra]|uniref:LOW QUALITY PROTEIN: G-protein coupled receptor moody-like n=1 Tax=Haliotis rubra TaxID=36100 RepID=UPI001EE5CD14|nr:LOW QUALITY PROTEIN: G-protein coupled receptor moody-like [Haliotis rubra]
MVHTNGSSSRVKFPLATREELVWMYSVDKDDSGVSMYIAVIVMAIIIITGCAGNIMAILAVKTTRKLQTVSNMFVVNLSVCDLMFLLFVLPFNIYTYIADGWYIDTNLCKFVGILGYTLTGTTIITITLIAWNRYKMVTDLAAYKTIFVPSNISAMLMVAWILPLLGLTPAIVGAWGQFGNVPMLVTCNLILDHDSQAFKLFLLLIRAVIPSVLITFFYARIYSTTRASHRRMVRPSILNSILDLHNQRKEMHLTRMMIAIFIVFAMSYFPCTVSSIIDWNTVLSKQFHMFCSITVYVGSAINPLIYGLMNSQFRRAYFSIVSCKKIGAKKDVTVKMSSRAPGLKQHLGELNQLLPGQQATSLLLGPGLNSDPSHCGTGTDHGPAS